MNLVFRKGMVFQLLVAVAMLVSACGSNNVNSTPESNAEGSNTVDNNTEVQEISFIHWRGEDVDVFNEIIKRFEDENPNIKVKQDTFPSTEYQGTAQQKLLDGTTGDVFAVFPGGQYTAILEAGLFEDLTNESFVDNFQPNLIAAGQTDGKQYGLPYQLVYNQPLYNKGMFEQYGIEYPTDWESFLEACETLKQNGLIPISFAGADVSIGQFMNSMMMNEMPEEDIWERVMSGEAKITDEWWINTLNKFKELNDKGYFQADSLGTKQEAAKILFVTEKAAMLATGSYHASSTLEQNPNIKLGLLAPITTTEDEMVWEGIHTTTFMLSVNSKSSKKDAAKKFIAFLSKPEIAEYYANETGQLSTVKDVAYTSESLKVATEWLSKNTRFQPRYLITDLKVQNAVTASVSAVLSGKTPEEAARDSQKIIDETIN